MNNKLNKTIKSIAILHWFHWIIIIASLLLTTGAWYFSKTQIEKKNILRFEHEVEQIIALIKERMGKYEDALWSGVAAIKSQSHGIDHKEWKRFADTLNIGERYPGINGIGLIYHLKPNQLDNFLSDEQKTRPNYKIYPPHDREDLFPIVYIEPVQSNKEAVGLDIAHEKNRYDAAIKAKNTGKAQITGPIILVQDEEKTPGFLFYAPFYQDDESSPDSDSKKYFKGLVYAPFIMKNLMGGTLKKENRLTTIRISEEEQTLYDEKSRYTYHEGYKHTETLEMYGRPWRLQIRSNAEFHHLIQNNQPLFILIAGLIIDILLFTLFFVLSRSKTNAVNYADKVTRDLKEAQEFQNLIKESNPDMLFVKDENFCIVDANTAFMNVYPKNQQNHIIGYTTLEQYEDDEAEEFLKYDKIAFKTGKSETLETIKFPDGKTRILLTKKIRFKNPEGKNFILGIARDVTEREKLVEQLKTSNQELDDFAYISSHDLKEPLRGIQNHSNYLLKKYSKNIDEEGKRKLDRIVYLTSFMKKLISDLLYYSRLGRSEEAYKPTDIKLMLRDMKEAILASSNEPLDIRIMDDIPTIHCNSQYVYELFYNLINNAIKYNDSTPKTIEIGVVNNKNKNGKNNKLKVFYVRDNGIGIDPKHQNSIFKIFKRLHKKDSYGGGTGSGLTFVKKIVEQHEGKIWLESNINEGSTFYFTLKQ